MHFALCLAIDNQKEVELAKLAAQRAQSDEVKQFAQTMQQQHGEFLNKLNELTGGRSQAAIRQIASASPGVTGAVETQIERTREQIRGTSDNAQPRETAQRSDSTQQRQQVDTQRTTERRETQVAGGPHGQTDPIQIKAEIAAECLKSAKQELSSKSGAEFDKCYMTAQAFAHMTMNDVLTVFERHASPALAQHLTSAKATTKQHLDMAKQLVKKLDSTGQAGRDTVGLNR
jgi:predicted outer membrane protein